SDEEIVTRISPDSRFAGPLAGVSERVLVSGHTHVQFDRAVLGRRWINAGSVGMPYQGRPGAFWALLGPDVEFHDTPSDSEGASERILASGFPKAAEFTRGLFVTPMSAEAASQQFEHWTEDRARARR